MKIDLQKKNILVTGSSRGIGAAISKELGKSGARIAIHYKRERQSAEEIAKIIGNNSKVFKANLQDPDQCELLFKSVLKEFGHIDAIVNNAGTAILSPLNNENWVKEWDKTMSINLRAVGILCKLAIQHFKTRKSGRIINIASRAAFRGDTAEYLAYAASKAGVVSLSKSIARAFGKDGITCFVVAPGWVKTDMANESIEEYGDEYILQGNSLDRLTEPEDIAPIVTLLASGLADHATGTTIDINAASYVH
jgi:NAD(P)-dependent dehydrogenase (short-subunit alcohol dehydrogenase family)